MKYGAHIDGYAALKDNAGFRFNVYLWQSVEVCRGHGMPVEDETLLDLYVKGLRVKGSLIHMPAMGARLSSYPTTFLPKPFAEAVVKEVLENAELRREFPDSFPLLQRDLLVDNLMFNPRDMPRDFPKLAQLRGMMEA